MRRNTLATKTEVHSGRRAGTPVLFAPLLAALLAALAGCVNEEFLRAHEELREELETLQARLVRIESDTAMQSRKIRELSDLQDRRASEAEGAEPVPAKDLAVGRPLGPADSTGAPPRTEADGDGGEGDGGPADTREVPTDPFTRRVQQALRNAGCDPGPIDGKAGAMTKRAIRKFQRDNNLPDTGVANEATWDLLKRYE